MVAAAAARWRPSVALVSGGSMAPLLLPGDRVIILRAGRPRRGDVVVARHPDGFEMVKRVSAGPGDEAMPGWVLSADQWLLVGDRREASTDSRSFGAVPSRSILGTVVWPLRVRRSIRSARAADD